MSEKEAATEVVGRILAVAEGFDDRAHAHALILTGDAMGMPESLVNADVTEDTGYDPVLARREIAQGNVDPAARPALELFEVMTGQKVLG